MSLLQPFGVDIAGLVGSAFDGNMSDATLISVAPGTLDPAHASSGTTPTRTNHSAQGFIAAKSVAANTAQPQGGAQPGTTLSKTGKTVIALFGSLIADGAVPTMNDLITIDGATYTIVSVDFDQTGAIYMCTCRP